MSESKITQKALAIAIKELMQEFPFSKINVRDICEQCGISRKSFYYHFRDKYDLVNWIFYTEHLCTAANKNYENCWQYFYDVCNYLYQNKEFYLKALEYTGQNSFQEYFREACFPSLIDFWQETLAEKRPDTLEFIADISLLVIIRWLQNSQEIGPKQFIVLARDAVKGIAALIENDDAF